MQIHELNTFNGTPGQTDFLAIDTGFDTAKISARDLLKYKTAIPVDSSGQPDNGSPGQLLRTKGNGSTEWVDEGLPTDEQTAQAIEAWLDQHPEATTTVLDGSLSNKKLVLGTMGYVIPEMFGAVGDGNTDDSAALQAAFDYNLPVFLPRSYFSSAELKIKGEIRGGSLKFAPGLSNCLSNYEDENNISLININIDASGNTNAIIVIESDDLTIEGCEIQNFNYGIIARGGDRSVIKNNIIHNGVYYGIMIQPYNGIDSRDHLIAANSIYSIKSSNTPGASVDGQGIVIYGQTQTAPYIFVNGIKITDNHIYSNGRNGIALIGAKNATIKGNVCSEHNINNTGSGIVVSEACYGITIIGNICNGNKDGITTDVQTINGDANLYGCITIEGNICLDNAAAGIRNENANYISVIGNRIENSYYGIFCHDNALNTIITNNAVKNTTNNGIRLIGSASAYDSSHTNKLILAYNNLFECGGSGNTAASLFIYYYDDVVAIGNIAYRSSGYTLGIEAASKNNIFIGNKWNANVLIGTKDCFKKWNDDLSEVINLYASGYGGNSIDFTYLDTNKTIPVWGRDIVRVGAYVNGFVCSDTEAIANGYTGQTIRIVVLNGSIVIKHGGNISNIGSTDVTLGTRDTAVYIFRNSKWNQLNN